jgi:hypothetical protein
MHGGIDCTGSNVRTEKCAIEPCPGKLGSINVQSIHENIKVIISL